MIPGILTYTDAINHLVDFLSGNSTSAGQRDIRRAIHAAYRELSAYHWKGQVRHGRLHLSGLYSTGTVTYVHATRTLTLAGGTFPDWAEWGKVKIDGVISDVASMTDTANLVLDSQVNPGADISTATDYELFRSQYLLPNDFLRLWDPQDELSILGEYCTPEEWQARERLVYCTQSSLDYYTVMPLPGIYGTMALCIYPPASEARTLDFAYETKQRRLRFTGVEPADKQGTVSTTAASATVTGVGTAFSSDMVGAIIRIGDDGRNDVTGLDDRFPFVEERSIAAVASATSLTLDAAVTHTLSGVKYAIADPVDIEEVAFNAFLRCCEKHLAITRNMKSKAEVLAMAQMAMDEARSATNARRSFRVAGSRTQRQRWSDYATYPDDAGSA